MPVVWLEVEHSVLCLKSEYNLLRLICLMTFSSERGHSEESQNSSREPSHGQAEGREGRQVEEAGRQGPNDR